MHFEQERAAWLVEHYTWLCAKLPKREESKDGALILPSKEFFPFTNTLDHTYALSVFEKVKGYLEISNWSCALECLENQDIDLSEELMKSGAWMEGDSKGAAGTFEVNDHDEVVITYSKDQLKEPMALIATFAHELSHYLLATLHEEPPCGWSEHEYLTDLTAVKEGFGIFMCNSAFMFNQVQDSNWQGWKSQSLGYLTESELSFCLAIYCLHHGIDFGLVADNLKPNGREYFGLALEDLQSSDELISKICQ